ncbi:MAG: alpha-ketoglutarate-dependent taurine dioxygenase [Halioglobus sp.]
MLKYKVVFFRDQNISSEQCISFARAHRREPSAAGRTLQAGSIAFWDNRASQHFAASDYFPAVCVMERVTIAGDKPSF